MLGERVRQVLERIPPGIGGTVSEIRLRVGQPLGLFHFDHVLFFSVLSLLARPAF